MILKFQSSLITYNVYISCFREQPIFTCKAHVFHIDPKTKRSWIAASAAAVNVSFFYDSSRGLYRIISVEGTKVRCHRFILSKSVKVEISPPIYA